MAGKYIKLPKGLKRARIVTREDDRRISAEEYAHVIEEEKNKNRIAYRLIEIYGVHVYVKVEQT